MSENKDNGGPAFPLVEPAGEMCSVSAGMSLRDYFACHASDEDLKTQANIMRESQRKQYGVAVLPDNWTSVARYMHADAMLEARK